MEAVSICLGLHKLQADLPEDSFRNVFFMQIATLRNAEDLPASRTKREELGVSCLRRTIFPRHKGYAIAMMNEGNIEENALCWK